MLDRARPGLGGPIIGTAAVRRALSRGNPTVLPARPLAFLLVLLGLVAAPALLAQVSPPPEGQVVVLRGLDRAGIDALASHIDIWHVDSRTGEVIARVDAVGLDFLERSGHDFEIHAKHTKSLDRVGKALLGQTSGIPGFPCYRTVEETYATADAIVADYPDMASSIDIGDSWEKIQDPANGYDLRVLRLGPPAAPDVPSLFVNTAIHSREYTTAELGTRFAEYLVENYGTDPDITWLLDHHAIHFNLVANPDGRKRAETGLSWRKNTNDDYCTGTDSRGADLNRNFEFQWGCCGGSSSSACSTTYRGPSPASEPEDAAIQTYLRSIFPDQRDDALDSPAPDDATGIMLDVHSFGEDVLWSWGFTTTQPPAPNGAQIYTLGRKYAYFTDYRPQHGSLSTVDGSTKDFAYGVLGVPGFTIELGNTFFEPCAAFESKIWPDNRDALIYTAKVVRTPYLTPAGPETIELVGPPLPVHTGGTTMVAARVDDTRYGTANGTEPSQNIAAAEIWVNDPPWSATEAGVAPVSTPGNGPIAMAAADGSFDSASEEVTGTVDTTGLAPGRHQLFLRGQDSDGNWGAISGLFLYVIDPATAPTLEGRLVDAETLEPIAGIVEVGPFRASSDAGTGAWSLQVPSGSWDLSASADGYRTETVTEIAVADSEIRQQNFALRPYRTAFLDDVELGNAGWTAQAPWAISNESSNSPSHAWSDSPGTDYGDGIDTSLTSPLLDMRGLSGVSLELFHTYVIESGFDFGRVELSTDDGGSWTEVAIFSGVQESWQATSLELPGAGGSSEVRIRFRLTSDAGVTEDGWHIDDIHLRAVVAPLFEDGFESGNTSAWSLTHSSEE